MAAEQDKTTSAIPAETPAAPAVAVAETPVEKAAEQPSEKSEETSEKKSAEKAEEAVPVPAETPATKLNARLADIIATAGHSEMWGVQLSDIEHVPTKVVLQKFLRANNNDVAAAERQLSAALQWRKKMQPASLVTQTFDKKKFNDLGFITTHKADDGKETIITWNIYGSVKDNKATFGNVEEFIKWRAAIMELSVQKLNLAAVTEPIPEGGEDPYQMIQVHDYMSVSFFRMDPAVKAASKETISVLSTAYPELLAHKYFVNVPAIMGWMFGAMKLFLAPATLRKFHPMSSGTTLATELKSIVSSLPKEYGGQGPSVKEGVSISLADAEEKPVEQPAEETALVDRTKPAEESKLVTETQPTEVVKPASELKPAEEAKLVEEIKPVEEVKPVEETKPEVKAA
ncbi:CRAL-TRIO domain-containing protein [Dactylonectria estremocensis]|uniref:Phosphatidylinositol transfer protein SFH5 n=1 Tax=Dactylonectria estremocensis TaxID=1079267 RepID=A0A9P9FAD2_9HYPO|nr:CRAL-TRIO domain-containing protein [Dactylonectria estremocensis]